METKSILKTHEPTEWTCPDWRQRAVWSGAFCLAVGYVFFDLLKSFSARWSTEPQYSHGFAIPLIAAGLGWFLSDHIAPGKARSNGWGLVWLTAGIVMHILGVYVFVEFADCLGLLCCVVGGILLIWGRRLTVGVWPAIFFLVFMFPLPFRVERMLSAPLQLYGAEQSAWYIQMFGIPAVAKGSMILMGDHKLGVAEACSGMRMLTVFIAISVATMIVCQRSLWEKAIILFSAVPIALICNIGRIVATALAHDMFGQKMADLVFHDLSGWLMMPAAMLLLYLLLKILDWVFVPAPHGDHKLRTVKHSGLPGVPTVSKI
ncbi:MAG: exosortase/archaeosortase family protein [Planctomycetaceae bacterium]